MSIGQRLEEDELSDTPIETLYEILGERDTAKLYGEPFKVDTSHDIPFGAGNSIDRKTVYIDRVLYVEAMDNAFAKTGLEPQQIIDRWVDHEHCEKSILDGDNPVDIYSGAHVRALRREHEGVLVILGQANKETKIRTYEAVIWPAIVRAYKIPKNPPRDLWCGPLNDEPDEKDEEILKVMQRLGVTDAGKRSKHSTHYGIGDHRCVDCAMWCPKKGSDEDGQLAICTVVSGFVRDNRHCDFWKKATAAREMAA